MVFEDLNVFHSQEECVSMDPAQQPTSEKDNVGEMMLLSKKSSLLCIQIVCCSKSVSFISGTFEVLFTPAKAQMHICFTFVLFLEAEPSHKIPAVGDHFPCTRRQ